MDTPPQILARKIVEHLVRESILTEQEAAKAIPKIAEGKMRAEDWRLSVEVSAAKKSKP